MAKTYAECEAEVIAENPTFVVQENDETIVVSPETYPATYEVMVAERAHSCVERSQQEEQAAAEDALRRKYRWATTTLSGHRSTLATDIAAMESATPPSTVAALRAILLHVCQAAEDEMQIMAGLLDILRLSGIVLEEEEPPS